MELESICLDSTTPREFYSKYIARRVPIKFSGAIGNLSKWSNDYIKSKAGECVVKVEHRATKTDPFGKGHETSMKFLDFIDQLSNGSELLYLTTQKLLYSPEGQPHIISPPLTHLTDDMIIRPSIMGNLIPQNINIWMGQTTAPSTSGLHHDFHDNLYIVLRGTKSITLIPPSEAYNMYTIGKIAKVHFNGRINYEGQITMADGSEQMSKNAMDASRRLDEAVNKLHQKVCF